VFEKMLPKKFNDTLAIIAIVFLFVVLSFYASDIHEAIIGAFILTLGKVIDYYFRKNAPPNA
jgi:hypothetical protein